MDFTAMEKELGTGPMRFAPVGERSFQEQLESLSDSDKECFDELKRKWEVEHPDKPTYSDEMILRFARCSPGVKKFNVKTAWKVMERYNRSYQNVKATDSNIEKYLLNQPMFPVPGLKTRDGNLDVFYMGPNRKKPDHGLVDSLIYCMEAMVEHKEDACSNGFAVVVNMSDWTIQNFSIQYCIEVIKVVQGRLPVRIRNYLMVNPPGWTNVVWSILKPMLPREVCRKVILIPLDRLSNYFPKGFEAYFPDELKLVTAAAADDDNDGGGGRQADTAALAKDFFAYRTYLETNHRN